MNMKNFPRRLDSKTSCLRIAVPENLDLALEGLIRKVLREQPKTDDIYSFAADYFETLLKIRDKTGAKFTATQLCPFHNDEDAHEMIKLAGTFPKPASGKTNVKNVQPKTDKRREIDGKGLIRKQSKKQKERTIEHKQTTPDLIKKLPKVMKPQQTNKQKLEIQEDNQLEAEAEKENEEEFLASDPIKELVEKELMTEAISSKKTEAREKTDTDVNNTQKEGTTYDENLKNKTQDKSQETKDEKDIVKTEEEKEKGKTSKDADRVEEEGKSSTNFDNRAAENGESGTDKNEEGVSELTKTDEQPKLESTEETKEVENTSEESRDLAGTNKDKIQVTEKGREEDNKEETNPQQKETNQTLPINEFIRKTESLQTGKSSEDISEKDKNAQNRDEAQGKSDTTDTLLQSEQQQREGNNSIPSVETSSERTIIKDEQKLTEQQNEVQSTETKVEENQQHAAEQQAKNTETQARDNQKSTKQQEEVTNGETKLKDDQQLRENQKEVKSTETKVEDQHLTEQQSKNTETQAKDDQQSVEQQGELKDTETSAETLATDVKREIEVKNSQQPTEDKPQTDTEQTKPVKETPAFIAEQKSVEISPVGTTSIEETDGKEERVNNAAESTTGIIQTNVEKEAELQKAPNQTKKEENSSMNSGLIEQTTAELKEDEPKLDRSLVDNEEKAFGEVIKNIEEQMTNEVKGNHAENPDNEITKQEDTLKEEAKPIPEEARTDISDKPEDFERATGNTEEPTAVKSDDLKSENNQNEETSNSDSRTLQQQEAKIETKDAEIDKKIKNEEIQSSSAENKTTGDELITTMGETSTKNLNLSEEEPKTVSEEPTKDMNQEETGDELCSVVDIDHIPKETKNDSETAHDKTEPEEKFSDDLTQTTEEKAVDIQQIPKEDAVDETKPEEGDSENSLNKDDKTEELCSVVDVEQIPKEDKLNEQKTAEEKLSTAIAEEINEEKTNETKQEIAQSKEDKMEPKEETNNSQETQQHSAEVEKETGNKLEHSQQQSTEELKAEIDMLKESQQQSTEHTKEPNSEPKSEVEDTEQKESKKEATEIPTEINTQHIIKVEEAENTQKTESAQQPGEIQIKTIQTHYYDTLQVPETVTREYKVHNVVLPAAAAAGGLLGAVGSLQRGYESLQTSEDERQIVDDNMNSVPTGEFLQGLSISPPAEETTELPAAPTEDTKTEIPQQVEEKTELPFLALPLNQNDVEADAQKTDSDDFLDLMTPTSGYSLNLSETSMLTVSEVFLDSEKRYSSIEKEDIRYATPKTDETTEKKTKEERQEVEEVIEKIIVPASIEAVPVPPREAEEINEEGNLETAESVKDEEKPENAKEKKEEEKPENDSPEGSSNGKSEDSDIPFISVEVKTVIETQLLDDEDEDKNDGVKEHPEVEVNVQATIDIQDEMGTFQTSPKTEMSDQKTEQKDLKPTSEDIHSRNQDEERKESCSTDHTTGMEGSSLDSDLTTSSAATEIKRTDSAKKNSTSVRSLVSAQSLDLGKRNPLVKTRSLSSFRHGVTDFEVWNKIEKELEDAAIKIQSKFRGYKTRKKLQRGNAVQITTEESSVSTTPVEAEVREEGQQSTGEFHDSIILSEHPR